MDKLYFSLKGRESLFVLSFGEKQQPILTAVMDQ